MENNSSSGSNHERSVLPVRHVRDRLSHLNPARCDPEPRDRIPQINQPTINLIAVHLLQYACNDHYPYFPDQLIQSVQGTRTCQRQSLIFLASTTQSLYIVLTHHD